MDVPMSIGQSAAFGYRGKLAGQTPAPAHLAAAFRPETPANNGRYFLSHGCGVGRAGLLRERAHRHHHILRGNPEVHVQHPRWRRTNKKGPTSFVSQPTLNSRRRHANKYTNSSTIAPHRPKVAGTPRQSLSFNSEKLPHPGLASRTGSPCAWS